jgi:hypothetical protein
MASVVNPQLPITDRLGIERSNRADTTNPKAEAVFTAFGATGVALNQPVQHMAATYDARFCVGTKTTDGGLAISVCEYANEADATKGRALSQKILEAVKNRKVWRDKTTTLAIIEILPNPANDAAEKTLVDAFNKL